MERPWNIQILWKRNKMKWCQLVINLQTKRTLQIKTANSQLISHKAVVSPVATSLTIESFELQSKAFDQQISIDLDPQQTTLYIGHLLPLEKVSVMISNKYLSLEAISSRNKYLTMKQFRLLSIRFHLKIKCWKMQLKLLRVWEGSDCIPGWWCKTTKTSSTERRSDPASSISMLRRSTMRTYN